jgi:hypothetical protein
MVLPRFPINAEETAMSDARTSHTGRDAPKTELTEAQLSSVSGGVVSPRDAASGLPTGKRMHKPYTVLADLAV